MTNLGILDQIDEDNVLDKVLKIYPTKNKQTLQSIVLRGKTGYYF